MALGEMQMATAEMQYVTDVLGVRSILTPEGTKVAPSLYFVFTHEISESERSLADKMAKAMGFPLFSSIVVNQCTEIEELHAWTKSHLIVCFTDELLSFEGEAIGFGDLLEANFGSVIQTHDISKLNDSSHAYLQQMKKQAWTHMKQIM